MNPIGQVRERDAECAVLTGADGSSMIFVSTPRKCPVCQEMSCILINRDGKTRCWECHGNYRDSGSGVRDSGAGRAA
jgi:hypothetical protein